MDQAEAPPIDAAPYLARLRELFVRCPDNPIIEPKDMPMPCKAVCNPGAAEVGEDILLLLRVIDEHDRSSLVVARSLDGKTDWRIESEPLLKPNGDWYDEWGCEDPRITYVPDRAEYVIVYVGYSRFGAGVCLATTTDFKTVAKLGMVLHPYNKDAALFPDRINGKYRLLHRPTMAPLEDIWISESDDLIHWGKPFNVLQESDRPGWQGGKIGTGPPPYRGVHGWILVYHGVERTDDHWIYRTGIAILDGHNPQNVVRTWPEWVFGPQEPYEYDDRGQGIVFPTGLIRRDGTMLLYYGAGDRSVCLATADLEKVREVSKEFLESSSPPDDHDNADFFKNRPEERA